MARVRLPTSTTTSSLLVGSIAVHTSTGSAPGAERLVVADRAALRSRSTAWSLQLWTSKTEEIRSKSAQLLGGFDAWLADGHSAEAHQDAHR